MTADLLGQINKLLPEAGGIWTARAKGKDSMSDTSPSGKVIGANGFALQKFLRTDQSASLARSLLSWPLPQYPD